MVPWVEPLTDRLFHCIEVFLPNIGSRNKFHIRRHSFLSVIWFWPSLNVHSYVVPWRLSITLAFQQIVSIAHGIGMDPEYVSELQKYKPWNMWKPWGKNRHLFWWTNHSSNSNHPRKMINQKSWHEKGHCYRSNEGFILHMSKRYIYNSKFYALTVT